MHTFLWMAMLLASLVTFADTAPKIWTLVGDETVNLSLDAIDLPVRYSIFRFNDDEFNRIIDVNASEDRRAIIPLPNPEGILANFTYWNSALMHPDLAFLNPEIFTLQGVNADEEHFSVRFDKTPEGFHGQSQTENGIYYISPLRGNLYIVYYAKDYRPLHDFGCENEETVQQEFLNYPVLPLINYGTIKRTYRLAISATGEYTTATGGKSQALSSIVTAINFINGIYEAELNVKLQLVANNLNIIYTNALIDPFTPEVSTSSMLAQNQTSTDLVIGSANYDIGHVVHSRTGSGNSGSGVATLSTPCRAGVKARGVSTATRIGQTPINPFFYRILAHEMGHQFGAHHSFNASCNSNRTDSTAYETGGGSTIMSYAGGCSPLNVQTYADFYFHRINLEEISAYLAGSNNTCPVITNTGNAIPTADAGFNYVIPRSTPFVLTGAGFDANGHVITYAWEQYDKEIAVMPPVSTGTVGPAFRSILPVTSAQRYFPRLTDILSNISPMWEVLPSVSRTLNFSLVVRDNLGAASSDNTVVTIDGTSGPFVVTSPNGGETRRASITVTWNPANTNVLPVNATLVDILLSTNNGSTFASVLANNTPNDGSQVITLPAISTSQARIQVKAEGNIFFDVSNGPFTITP